MTRVSTLQCDTRFVAALRVRMRPPHRRYGAGITSYPKIREVGPQGLPVHEIEGSCAYLRRLTASHVLVIDVPKRIIAHAYVQEKANWVQDPGTIMGSRKRKAQK